MLGRLVNETLERTGPEYPWGGALSLLRGADLVLVNLECALTAHRERWRDDEGREKAFYFRSEPDHVRVLSAAGVDLAVLANNHVMDFGIEGMRETIRVLDAKGISHVGAGENEDAARACARLRAGELRVSVVAFADHPAEWAAGPAKPGISFVPIGPGSLDLVADAIERARHEADLVIASFHWGPNMCPRPSEPFQGFARSVIDAGADIFWGHSAHCVQGVEVRAGRLICFDTGDLVDDYAVDDQLRNDLSALFLVRVADRRITRLDVVPMRIDGMRVDPATGEDRRWFARTFAAYCGELGTTVGVGPDRLTISVRGG